MYKRKVAIILLLAVIIFSNSPELFSQNNLPFQDYRLALRAVEDGNWNQAHNYLDRVITRDYARSNYLAKSIYLKTILLTAELDRDLRLKKAFLTGEEGLDVEEEELRTEYEEKIREYEQDANRRVDTLIGLSNYLLSNLPPVEVELSKMTFGTGYSENDLTAIKSGELIDEDYLRELEQDLFDEKVSGYFRSTLGMQSDVFDNVYTIRAREGDNLSQIADKYDVPLTLLIRINDHIRNPDRIQPGERIYIPRTANSYIDYPAYFYYLSQLAYQANPDRRDDVMRMVAKAYQLTGSREQIDSEMKALTYEMEADDYRRHVEESTEYIAEQDQELEELMEKYEALLEEFSQLREELEDGTAEREETETEEIEEVEEGTELDFSY